MHDDLLASLIPTPKTATGWGCLLSVGAVLLVLAGVCWGLVELGTYLFR